MNPSTGTTSLMREMGVRAKAAARAVAQTSGEHRDRALFSMAAALRENAKSILAANRDDIAALQGASAAPAFVDRLKLDLGRIEAMAKGLEDVAERQDPIGRTLETNVRPNGLRISRVTVPIGVIGIIYESRPNVTADAGALCLKSGNAAILRGGSEALRSSIAIHQALRHGLQITGMTPDAIQLVPIADRDAVGCLLQGLDQAIDMIVPRGGKSLVKRVQDEARVPVLAHLDGVNHIYVSAKANPEKALAVVLNSKMRRVSVCGAAETVLIDAAAPAELKQGIVAGLLDAGCAVRGDSGVRNLDPRVTPATDADWSAEYLDAIISARIVSGVAAAVAHIETYGSRHTDAIVTEDENEAERFLHALDSAIVLWNASTQFADGAEFGMGAEIGIATGRLHARGPVGADQLVTYKYVVRGDGQIRP